MTNTLTMHTDNLDDFTPLYHKYYNQASPQPAYLEIRPVDNFALFDYSEIIGGGVPFNVYQRIILRVDLSPCASGESLLNLASDSNFIDAINRAIAGHTVTRIGRDGVGSLNSDATAALRDIKKMLDLLYFVPIQD